MLLEARELSKNYGSYKAVNQLSLSLNEGEIIALLGPNGAGKSTTMGMLVGTLTPTRGDVFYRGQAIRTCEKTYHQEIGVVPQEIALFDQLSVEENMKFFASLHGIKGKGLKVQVDRVLTLLDLLDHRKKKVQELSGGMKRKLNIGVALIHQPKILFMDEPTVGIDLESKFHIFDMLETLRSEKMTILISSHILSEMEKLCDRFLVMHKGEIIKSIQASETVDLTQLYKDLLHIKR